MGCDFRANGCRVAAFDSERGLLAPTAKAKESWSRPCAPCGRSAVGNSHTGSLIGEEVCGRASSQAGMTR
jgi:hypothetical protein